MHAILRPNRNLGDSQSILSLKTQIWMYFCRLNTDAINPLLKEAYNVNTKLNNGGIHTWYTVALKIFDECEMDLGEYENLDRPFNKIKQSLKF